MTFLKKKQVKEAFKKAKKLEKEEILTPKKFTEMHDESMKQIGIMQKLLQKTWFVKSKDTKKKSPTRNKKS